MEYICNKCNKNYSSYQSLWIHNKNFHKPEHCENTQLSTSITHKSTNIEKLTCNHCNKTFSRSDSLNRHYKSCNEKIKKEELNKIKIKEEIKTELKNELKMELYKNQKPTTKIINKVSGNLINGNNQDIGNKQIIYKTGNEIIESISYEEVSTIFDNEIFSVIKLIELINFNESKPENHSFCSTALESAYLSYYNTDTNSVNKERKKYFFESVICKSIQNHEILYDKFKNKFDKVKRQQIEDNIYNLKKMRDNSFNNKIMGEMIRNLNLLSYNKRNLIQDTWDNKSYENDSDEEFMKILLGEPDQNNKIEYKNFETSEIKPAKRKQLINNIYELLSEIKNTEI